MSKRVPKLRFKEFSGEWEEKKLGDICKFFSGGTPKTTNKDFYNGNIPFIKSGEIEQEQTEQTITPKGLENSSAKMVKKGDLLYALYGATSGEVAISKINGAINQAILCMECKEISNYFLFSLLKERKNFLKVKYLQGGQGNFSGEIVKKFKFYFPISRNEQQKIANTLSSLDNLIEAGEKKVEALKKHKKGLMQQLFPQEGEKTPKLRFKEFSGEWEEKKLDEVSDIVRGGSPRPIDKYMTSDPKGLNWLKIGDVDKNSKYVVKTEERVKHSALTKTREVHPGDLILSNSMSFGRPYIMKIKSCIHDGWIAITNIDSNIETDFLYYMILSPYSQKFFIDNAAGGGIRNLNADIIKSLPTYFPIDKKEQQKIANTLSSLDNLIEAKEKKIEALKKHKKGLMQQMFVSKEN